MNVLIWFLVAAIAAALPIPLLKQYTNTKKIGCILLSFLCYGILIPAYTILLQLFT